MQKPGSLMHMLYQAHAKDLWKRGDPLLKSPDWPERLAEQCAQEAQAYVRPGFLSRSGEVSLLPEESFGNYHVRREVVRRFNALVVVADDRNLAGFPETADPESPLSRKRSEKGAFLRENQPDFFQDADWPEKLTESVLEPGH